MSHAASCGTAASPQLNPEALTNINAPSAWANGATGAGVKVAFLADGLDINNPDFLRNAAYGTPGSPVIVDYQDFSGDGTSGPTGGAEAFGDAASIAAQGNTTYDLSNYVSPAHPLPAGCDIKVVGVAPGASVLALKIFASNHVTTGSGFVQAINYAVASGVGVINESFGSNPFPDSSTDIVKMANDAAVAAGVTVVVSTGDAGVSSTIGSPATDPAVIGVGATTTFRSYQQETFGGINAPGESGGYIDNNISSLSSGGFAQDGKTVDLVAPGDLGWSLCSADVSNYGECSGVNLQDFGGTSQSAPLTSGAAADVIQAYAVTHGGASPSPDLVKRILMSSASDISAPATQQGAGLLNVGAAVQLARTIPGTTAKSKDGGILSSVSQLNIAGNPDSVAARTIAFTNTGSKPETVHLSARSLEKFGEASGTVTLDPSVGTSQPTFSISSGALEIYQKATFTVPHNADRLKFRSVYQFTGQTSLLHVAIFDPSGNLAGYSLPQGLGDYADVEVANPHAGTWTAVFFTVWNGFGSGNVGTSGPVPWTASFSRFEMSGLVFPDHLLLGAGATQSATVILPLGETAGDHWSSIVVRSDGAASTIPVTLRTMIRIGRHGGEFHGTLTGGNGRGGAPGQTNTYAFNVPSGQTDLSVSLAMASNPGAGGVPGDQLIGMLIDPSGQLAAYDSNYTYNSTGPVVTPYLNLYRSQPAAGSWELVLDWAQTGAGVDTSIPFNGAVRFNQVSMSNSLPNSAASTVSASSGADFSVTVNNTGVAPMLVSADARTPGSVTLPVSDFFGSPGTQGVPNTSNNFFVPTETSSYSASMTSSLPMSFDTSTFPGDPDLSPQVAAPYVTSSWTPTASSVTFAPPTGVTPGLWALIQAEIGPYGSGPEPTGTETTNASVVTRGFDPAVTSSIGDAVAQWTFNGAAASIAPTAVDPGTSSTFTVHIAPTAAVGTTVSGTLFVNGITTGSFYGSTITFESIFASDIAAIPYQYTVSS